MSTPKVWKFSTGWAGITKTGKRIFGKTKSDAQSKAGITKRASPTKKRAPSKKSTGRGRKTGLIGNLSLAGTIEAIVANVIGTSVTRSYGVEDGRAASVSNVLYGLQGHVLKRRGKQFLVPGVVNLATDLALDYLESGVLPMALGGPSGAKPAPKTDASTWRYKSHKRKGESKNAFQARKRRAMAR